MSCYEDVLDAEDRLLGVSGHDITDPHKDDAIKHLSFKIKAAPDANTVSRLFDLFLSHFDVWILDLLNWSRHQQR